MLDIRGASPGLLDDPLLLEVGGAEPNAALTWRGRYRDDDGFVWRAAAPTSEGLLTAWVPAKTTAGPVAALRSLRPIEVGVRVEAPDGAASNRTIARRLQDDGVRARRWRDAVAGTLYLPATGATSALILDAPEPTSGARDAARDAAPMAAAILASRSVLVFVVTGGKGADPVAGARELVAALPGAPAAIATLSAADVGVPPGVGVRGEDQAGAIARGVAWDALLDRLGARARVAR